MNSKHWVWAIVLLHVVLAAGYARVTPYRTAGVVLMQGGVHADDIGAPDERQHVNYVSHLLSGQGFPVFDPKDPHLYESYQSHQPPLFYLAAGAYARCLGLDDLTDQRAGFLLRLLNAVVGGLAVAGVWYLARWGLQNQAVSVGAACFAALLPMNVALSGAVSNDPMLICFCTWCLALCAKGVRDGWNVRSAILVGILTGLALLTKTTAVTLLPVVALSFFLRSPGPTGAIAALKPRRRGGGDMDRESSDSHRDADMDRESSDSHRDADMDRDSSDSHRDADMDRESSDSHRDARTEVRAAQSGAKAPHSKESGSAHSIRGLRLAALCLGIAVLLALPWWIRNQSLYGDPLAIKAFNQAFTGSMQASRMTDIVGGPWNYWVKGVGLGTMCSFFGVFGYWDVWLDLETYYIAAGCCAVLSVAWAFSLRGRRAELPVHLLDGVFALLVLASFVRFNMQYFQAQGRYLMPALGPISVGLAGGLTFLARKRGEVAALCLAIVLFASNVYILRKLPDAFAVRAPQTAAEKQP